MKCKNVIFVVLILFLRVSLFSQENVSYSDYLKDNTKLYNEDYGLLAESDYSNYRMFATGEYHFRKENSKIFLKVFRNLYQKANVRIVFLESGYGVGLIAQHYLETGDYNSLKIISTDGQFDEFHYRFLKDFYDECPADDKFKIIGIDLDNYSYDQSFIYAAKLMFRDTVMPENLSFLLDDFELIINEEPYEVVQESFAGIYSDYRNNSENYKSILKDNYDDYAILIERMKSSLKFDYFNYNYGKDSIQQSRRENFIYKNLLGEIEKHPNCNYFGQFGLAHIGLSRFLILDEQSGVESFMAKLNNNQNSPLKGKVCSIAILYFEKFYGDYSKLNYYFSELNYGLSIKKFLPDKVYQILKNRDDRKGYYYVNLAKENSPFKDFSTKNFQFLMYKR